MQRESVDSGLRHSGTDPSRVYGRWLKTPRAGVNSTRKSGLAACGGMVRNEDGDWLIGFSKRIGICSILEAELWGLYEDLNAAWSINIRGLLVELDCLETVKLFNNHDRLTVVSNIVHSIVEVFIRPWSTKISHIGRESNCATDWMAKQINFDDLLCRRYLDPPDGLLFLLHQDVAE
ncbi:hypothetical protein V6N12_058864 [Hibiscus sabdariffa]|uniref:RNase H type-1 domain-containing protein n=1 Tax=Hibiscus sabdariffa TaxID=183260 RepID=A0ABR2ETF0_9ROSI